MIAALPRTTRPLLLGLLGLLLTGCVNIPPRTPAEPGEHPLMDRVWSARTQAFTTFEEMQEALARADYVLLGENHDNPVHHQLQAEIINGLQWPETAIAGFEQVDADQAPALEAWLDAGPAGTAGLAEALDWEHSGWPDWPLYEPVFAAVLERGWQPVDLMFPAATVRAVFSDGLDAALDAETRQQLQPDTLFSAEQRLAMQELMADAHCGLLPAEHMAAMVQVQIARDAYMASRLASARSGERAVVITGNGHARRDWGIPRFLQRLQPDATIVAVTMAELEPERIKPGDYAAATPAWSDFTIFTIAHDRGDPCADIPKAAGAG
ncbi:MAG: ChaN family lipoprotein [Haliea sp.]|uniref:ChaN family lipoprotein n=1 Tax=Haliea sp. TaxID=1932666 RepID=UPI0032EF7DC2